MPPVPPDTVVAHLRWRYATKKFDPAPHHPAGDLGCTRASFGAHAFELWIAAVEVLRRHRSGR